MPLVLLGLVLTACDDGESLAANGTATAVGTPTAVDTAAPEDSKLTIGDDGFEPAELSLPQPGNVTVWNETAENVALIVNQSGGDLLLEIPAGGSFVLNLEKSGSYVITSQDRPDLTASVVVR